MISKQEPTQRYLANILIQYGTLTLPIATPIHAIALQAIFQPLELRRNPLIIEDLSPKHRRELTSEVRERDEEQQQPIIALSAADALQQNATQRLVILGGPGSGKTTLLKDLVCWAATTALADVAAPLPIFVALPDLARAGVPLATYLTNIAAEAGIESGSQTFLWDALTNGKAFLCLDSLDEVAPALRPDIIAMIDRDVPTWGSACIVGSRFTEYRGGQFGHESFAEWEIKPLDHDLRIELAQRIIPLLVGNDVPTYAPDAFVVALETHPQAQAWGENPLLFSLAAVIYAQNGTLPVSRSVLYGDIIAAVLATRQLDPRQRRRFSHIFGEMALRLYQVKGRTFTRAEMQTILESIKPDLDVVEDIDTLTHDIIASGLLEAVAQETYGFRHQTFQEYMVAHALADRLTSDDTTMIAATKEFIWDKRTFSRWTEVLRLLVGILIRQQGASGATLVAWWLQALVGQRETADGDVGWLGLTLALTSLSEIANAPVHWQEGPAKTVEQYIVNAWATTMLIANDYRINQRLEALAHEIRYLPSAAIASGITPLTDVLQEQQSAIKSIEILEKLEEQMPLAPLIAVMYEGQTPFIRARAAFTLAAHGESIPLAEIFAYFDTDDYGLYEWGKKIAIALIQHGSDEVLNHFMRSLHDDNPYERLIGYEILMRSHQATVALLHQGLADPIAEVREHIHTHIRSLKEFLSIEAIVDVVTDPNIQRKPLGMLAGLGPTVPITIFIDALQSPDARIRSDAANAMQELGERMPIAPLVAALHDVDAEVRAWSANALGRSGARAPIDALLSSLHDPDEKVRRTAASALGNLGDHVSLEIIFAGMKSDDASIRQGLVDNLKKRHGRISAVTLLPFLRDPSAYVRQIICDVLGTLGDSMAITHLTPLLGDPYWHVRLGAVTALTQLGEPGKHISQESLLALLNTSDVSLQMTAATILGEARVPAAIDILLKTFHDTNDRELRNAVMETLGSMDDDAAMYALLTLLQDSDSWVRCEALGQLSERVPLEPLFVALQDADETVRQWARVCLVATGTRMPLEFIVAATNDTYFYVYRAALKALGDFGEAAPIEPLLAALCYGHRDEYHAQEIYEAAATSLGKLKERVPIEDLLMLLGDGNLPSSIGAAIALRELAVAPPLDQLLRAVASPHKSVRVIMMKMLGQQGENAPIEVLLSALRDPEYQVVLAAAAALGMVREHVPLERLLTHLESPDPFTRMGAAYALGQLGEYTPVTALFPLLNDPSKRVAGAAISALGELRQPQAIAPLLNALELVTNAQVPIARSLIMICGPEHVPARAVTYLLQSLHGADYVCREATTALIDLGVYAPIAPLVEMLGDTDYYVYNAAIQILGATHREIFADLVPEAMVILRDGQAGTRLGTRLRTQMANAIGTMKRVPPVLFNLLTDLLDWHYPETRKAAANAFGKIQRNIPDAAIRKLLAMRQGPERDSADQALAAILSLETGIEDD